MSLQRLNEHIKNSSGCVPDRARCSRYGGEEFLFHRFNPRTRTCTHTRDLAQGAYAPRIYKGPRRFSFRGYSPFFKLGKKKGECPCTLVHHIKLLRLLSTFLSSARARTFHPVARVCEKNSSSLGGRGNWSGTDQHPERGVVNAL